MSKKRNRHLRAELEKLKERHLAIQDKLLEIDEYLTRYYRDKIAGRDEWRAHVDLLRARHMMLYVLDDPPPEVLLRVSL